MNTASAHRSCAAGGNGIEKRSLPGPPRTRREADFQAVSSEMRMTEFKVILRASQFAKCISLKADTDLQKANRANSFI
jgi:hypothetical protein